MKGWRKRGEPMPTGHHWLDNELWHMEADAKLKRDNKRIARRKTRRKLDRELLKEHPE